MKKFKMSLVVAVALLFLTRLFVRVSLPKSYVVPDESTWSRLATWIQSGGDSSQFEGFTRSPYFGSQAFVLPSVWQMRLFNITSLDAVRNTSFLYGIGCIIIFALMIWLYVYKSNQLSLNVEKRNQAIPIIMLLIYGLMPSHTLWSILGLRDSAAEFYVMLVCLTLQISWLRRNHRLASSFLCFVGILGLSASRYQIAWLMCFLLVATSALLLRVNPRRFEFLVMGIILFPLTLQISSAPSKSLEQEYTFKKGGRELKVIIKNDEVVSIKSDGLTLENYNGNLRIVDERSVSTSPNSSVDNTTASNSSVDNTTASNSSVDNTTASADNISAALITELASTLQNVTPSPNSLVTPDSGVELDQDIKAVKKSTVNENLTAPIKALQESSNERSAKRSGASGVIIELQCPFSTKSKTTYFLCEIFRTPYASITFLFRPFFFEKPTSEEFRYASYENVLWLIMFILTPILAIRNRWKPHFLDFPTISFLIFFIPLAALTEGNFGTAVRHKSVTLWAILVLLLSVTLRKKDTSKNRPSSEKKSVKA